MKLFDLDGTLIDSNRLWQDVDEEFFRQRGLTLTQDYTDYVAHTNYPAAAVYTRERYALPESPEEIMAVWFDMAEHAYAHTVPLKPGVREYLTRERARGETLGIVTSCMTKLCMAALEHNGIAELFANITTVAEAGGDDKVSPAVWLLAAEKNHVKPEACTAFEDSYKGAQGARAAGMRVIGVYDGFFDSSWPELQKTAHRSIRSFRELLGPAGT